MTLHLPQALTLNNLNGGYMGHLDFTALNENQTNKGINTIITPTTVEQRHGYVRKLNTALTKTGLRTTTGLNGDPIKGHFHLKKSENLFEIKKHCVAAGTNLWEYNSSIANIILSGLNEREDAIWSFVQIQDPRDGTDDILIGTNGYDNPVVWNGTDDSAIFLSDISGASGVMPAKYIVSLKNRVALLNINDPSDVDSKSLIKISEIDGNGVPTPHVFPDDLTFWVGGSDKHGGITGGAALNGRLVVFKKSTFYSFEVGPALLMGNDEITLTHDSSLRQVDENIGCIAPRSIASIGSAVMFLSELGVYGYDGQNLVYLSQAIENDMKNINFSRRQYAAGGYDRARNEYWLSLSSSGKDYNDVCFVYNLTEKKWHTPFTDMRCDVISSYVDSSQEKLICGDKKGYLYELNKGMNNGKEIGYNLTPTTITLGSTITFKDEDSIVSNGDGLLGLSLRALGATGANMGLRDIVSATATQIKVSPPFGSGVNSNTQFCLLGIDSYFQTKDFDFGSPDMTKFVRRISPRIKQKGNINLKVNYFMDFNEYSKAGSATISQYDKNYICFTAGDYATGTASRFSGTIETVSVGTSSIAVSAGSDISASLLSGYCVYLWNSGTRRVRPIESGECNTLNLGLYGTQSEVAVNTATTYLINTNLENAAGTAKWGPAKTKKHDVSIRSYYTQQNVGDHFSVRFGNNRANETWSVYGFDTLAKVAGRR